MDRNMMMRDYLMRRGGRDGRNPYGSRGGYVTSRYPRRRDRAMGEDYARGGSRDYEGDYRRGEERDYNYDENDYARGRNSRGQFTRDGGMYPFEVSGEFEMYDRHHYDPYMMGEYDMARGGRDYAYDYGYGENVMSKQELEQKYHKLLQEVEESDKETFSKEKILKKAEEMGIRFDKFSPEALVTSTVMTYTDYSKTLGKGNLDTYILLGKDWLCDPDSKLKGDEKLTAYFDCVTM